MKEIQDQRDQKGAGLLVNGAYIAEKLLIILAVSKLIMKNHGKIRFGCFEAL